MVVGEVNNLKDEGGTNYQGAGADGKDNTEPAGFASESGQPRLLDIGVAS